jgi:hypothetical protein
VQPLSNRAGRNGEVATLEIPRADNSEPRRGSRRRRRADTKLRVRVARAGARSKGEARVRQLRRRRDPRGDARELTYPEVVLEEGDVFRRKLLGLVRRPRSPSAATVTSAGEGSRTATAAGGRPVRGGELHERGGIASLWVVAAQQAASDRLWRSPADLVWLADSWRRRRRVGRGARSATRSSQVPIAGGSRPRAKDAGRYESVGRRRRPAVISAAATAV